MSESIWTAAPSLALRQPEPFIQSLFRQPVLATEFVHRGEMKEELVHFFHPHQAESEFARALKIERLLPARRILLLPESREPSWSEMRTPAAWRSGVSGCCSTSSRPHCNRLTASRWALRRNACSAASRK